MFTPALCTNSLTYFLTTSKCAAMKSKTLDKPVSLKILENSVGTLHLLILYLNTALFPVGQLQGRPEHVSRRSPEQHKFITSHLTISQIDIQGTEKMPPAHLDSKFQGLLLLQVRESPRKKKSWHKLPVSTL